MPKFRLTSNFEKDLKVLYRQNNLVKREQSSSDYWIYHSNQIKYKIENSIFEITGVSGNYIPDKKILLSTS